MKKKPGEPRITSEPPLPMPAASNKDLRKPAAFTTLAVEQKNDPAVAEARQWVEYDEL